MLDKTGSLHCVRWIARNISNITWIMCEDSGDKLKRLMVDKNGKIWTSKMIITSMNRKKPINLIPCTYFFNLNIFNVYLFLRYRKRDRERQREREHDQGKGREKGKHRIWSRIQALSYQHRARPRAWTQKLWDHYLSQSWMLNRLSQPGAPIPSTYNNAKIAKQQHAFWSTIANTRKQIFDICRIEHKTMFKIIFESDGCFTQIFIFML